MIPLLLGIGVLAAPAVKQARYSRSESYAGQYVQRCNLTGVAVANKQALVNLDVMASKIYTFFLFSFREVDCFTFCPQTRLAHVHT